jgi:hypothetical protein
MQEALDTVDVAAFRADPDGSFETLRALLHSSAFQWAAHAVDVGRFLRVAKADLAPADWAEMLNKRGDTEEWAEALMADAETPVDEMAAALVDSGLGFREPALYMPLKVVTFPTPSADRLI